MTVVIVMTTWYSKFFLDYCVKTISMISKLHV